MIAKLLSFSLKNRLFVFITFLLIIAAGIQSFRQLPVDAFPEISPTQVKIILRAPGMAAERVENQVTHPIETELLGIPNQTILRSTTKYGITSITLDFEEGTDIYWARQQVAEKLAAVRDALEQKFGDPEEARLDWKPQNSIAVDEGTAETLFKLIDALEDNDDVQRVSANFDIDDEIMERLSA